MMNNRPEPVAGADVPCEEEEEDEGQDPTEVLRIMLLGKSGAGKSCSGNTILGKSVFDSALKLKRVTRFSDKEVGLVKDVPVDVKGKVEDVPVAVIDTPGLFETEREKEDIVREILKCVKLQEPGPHAFVFVIPVGRFTKEDQATQALIEARIGPKVWDYTIVLFTHGDRLEKRTINDVIAESEPLLRDFIRKCGGGFHVLNNKEPQEHRQVASFIAKIQTLVALNGGLENGYYNTDLYPEDEKRIRKRQEEILSEQNNEIMDKERKLKEKFKGKDLKMKKKKLWKDEEDNARRIAEKECSRPLQKLVDWTRQKPYMLLLLLIPIIAIFIGVLK